MYFSGMAGSPCTEDCALTCCVHSGKVHGGPAFAVHCADQFQPHCIASLMIVMNVLLWRICVRKLPLLSLLQHTLVTACMPQD